MIRRGQIDDFSNIKVLVQVITFVKRPLEGLLLGFRIHPGPSGDVLEPRVVLVLIQVVLLWGSVDVAGNLVNRRGVFVDSLLGNRRQLEQLILPRVS